MAHVASIVAIFGPTDPHNLPVGRSATTASRCGVCRNFACRPCYDGRDFAACSHNGCVRQITVAMVLEQIDGLLAAAREGRIMPLRIMAPESTSQMVFL